MHKSISKWLGIYNTNTVAYDSIYFIAAIKNYEFVYNIWYFIATVKNICLTLS